MSPPQNEPLKSPPKLQDILKTPQQQKQSQSFQTLISDLYYLVKYYDTPLDFYNGVSRSCHQPLMQLILLMDTPHDSSTLSSTKRLKEKYLLRYKYCVESQLPPMVSGRKAVRKCMSKYLSGNEDVMAEFKCKGHIDTFEKKLNLLMDSFLDEPVGYHRITQQDYEKNASTTTTDYKEESSSDTNTPSLTYKQALTRLHNQVGLRQDLAFHLRCQALLKRAEDEVENSNALGNTSDAEKRAQLMKMPSSIEFAAQDFSQNSGNPLEEQRTDISPEQWRDHIEARCKRVEKRIHEMIQKEVPSLTLIVGETEEEAKPKKRDLHLWHQMLQHTFLSSSNRVESSQREDVL